MGNINYSVIAYKRDNGLILVVAEGERTELQELLPTVKESIHNAKLLSVDEDDYQKCKNDIEFQNEFLATKM